MLVDKEGREREGIVTQKNCRTSNCQATKQGKQAHQHYKLKRMYIFGDIKTHPMNMLHNVRCHIHRHRHTNTRTLAHTHTRTYSHARTVDARIHKKLLCFESVIVRHREYGRTAILISVCMSMIFAMLSSHFIRFCFVHFIVCSFVWSIAPHSHALVGCHGSFLLAARSCNSSSINLCHCWKLQTENWMLSTNETKRTKHYYCY